MNRVKNSLKSNAIVHLIMMALCASSQVWAGGGSEGGGNPGKIDEAAIQMIIQGETLKNSLLNYLNTIVIDQVSDPATQAFFKRTMKDGQLQRDIKTPENYVISAACHDSFNEDVPASAVIGDVGGKICFDTKKLTAMYRGLSEEDVLIKLASLVSHEHVHHFQAALDRNDAALAEKIEKYETEAYQVSAYVQVTAKFAQTPTLKWSIEAPVRPPNPHVVSMDELKAGILSASDAVRMSPRCKLTVDFGQDGLTLSLRDDQEFAKIEKFAKIKIPENSQITLTETNFDRDGNNFKHSYEIRGVGKFDWVSAGDDYVALTLDDSLTDASVSCSVEF